MQIVIVGWKTERTISIAHAVPQRVIGEYVQVPFVPQLLTETDRVVQGMGQTGGFELIHVTLAQIGSRQRAWQWRVDVSAAIEMHTANGIQCQRQADSFR